ncbi:MAG: hypothetical protein WCG99_02605 [Candidatus Berkelbacteria bacterium]
MITNSVWRRYVNDHSGSSGNSGCLQRQSEVLHTWAFAQAVTLEWRMPMFALPGDGDGEGSFLWTFLLVVVLAAAAALALEQEKKPTDEAQDYII